MHKEILQEMERIFEGQAGVEVSKEKWMDAVDHFMPMLIEWTDSLAALAEKRFEKSVFRHSIKSPMFWQRPDATGLCSIDISPVGRGRDLQLSIGLYRSDQWWPANVDMRVSFYGGNAIQGFKELYANYRRPVEVLLGQSALKFETGGIYESLDKYRGKQAAKKLDLFFSEEVDDNEGFALAAEFYEEVQTEQVEQTFLVAAALYESCCGYISRRNRVDEIFGYYLAMKKRRTNQR